MKRYIIFVCSLLLLSGCVDWRLGDWERLEPIVVVPSFNSNYLLTCLSDTETLKRDDFTAQFNQAEADLKNARYLNMLRFVCLSLNEKADYKQFARGKKVLNQYLAEHPESGDDMQGFRFLVDRLDEEILNRWSAWKSLLNDKKELKAEVQSLKVRIEAQQKQKDQLKNIEKIIKSREAGQP